MSWIDWVIVIVPVAALLSKFLHKNQYIKVADLYITENFQRFLFKHTLLRVYVVLYGENCYGMNLL